LHRQEAAFAAAYRVECCRCLGALDLLTISNVLRRYALYACRYRSDISYYLFMFFNLLAISVGFFLLATIFGFFPETPCRI
jgi:hypothetical protein